MEFVDFKADVCNVITSGRRPIADLNQGEWQAVGTESGSKFTGIDLTEGEWYDYDEKAGEEVSIKDITWDIRRA